MNRMDSSGSADRRVHIAQAHDDEDTFDLEVATVLSQGTVSEIWNRWVSARKM